MKSPSIEHDWRFYLSPGATWEAMYEDCSHAGKSIEMEQYIFNNDEVGQKFMHLFIEKAKQGIAVRLLCDEVGSRSFWNSKLVSELRHNGGSFEFYNSLKFIDLFKPKLFFPRTHVKALVVDAAIAYIGGVCLAKQMENWRDTQMRVTGAVVRQIKEALDRNSFYDGHTPRPPKYRSEQHVAQDLFYIQNDPGLFRHAIYQALLEAIRNAKETIHISESIFIPTRRLRRYLKQAVRRGVEVIILVPAVSDCWIADWVSLSYAWGLLNAGIRIFQYEPTVLHTKIAMIDESWATVGSCNMDPLSFFHNRESNLILQDARIVDAMRKDFLNDLEHSREVTFEFVRQIPLWKRAIARLGRVLRPLL